MSTRYKSRFQSDVLQVKMSSSLMHIPGMIGGGRAEEVGMDLSLDLEQERSQLLCT